MSLTKVFDALTDAILVVNQTGEVSYFNKPGSKIIKGTHIETIGIDRLDEMLKLVLNEQIRLPFTFTVRLSNNTEYEATVSKLYSFYIVAISNQESVPAYSQQASGKGKNSTHVGVHIREMLNNEIELITSLADSFTDDAAGRLQGELGKFKSKLDMVMNAIFMSGPNDTQPVETMLEAIGQDGAFTTLARDVELNVYGLSEIDFAFLFCSQEWFEIILVESLNHLITDDRYRFDLVVGVDQDSHYLTIHIAGKDDSVVPFHKRLSMKKLIHSEARGDEGLTTAGYHDMALARHIVEQLQGYVAVLGQDSSGILIKLPTGSPPGDENELLLEQSRLFAQELGELRLTIDEATT